MADLAFEITNDLLNAGVIAESTAPSVVERVVRDRLEKSAADKPETVHFQDPQYTESYGMCHHPRSVKTTRQPGEVTCTKCRNSMRRRHFI